MQKLIRNNWVNETGKPFSRARVIHHKTHPEGLDVERVRFENAGTLPLNQRLGHIVSICKGTAQLYLKGADEELFHLAPGVHLYFPPGISCQLEAEAETELIQVTGPTPGQARGTRFLLRDEMFLAACTNDTQSLRWTFTPHFLSRLVFLHHDLTLLSKSGNPVSWAKTTMFDVAGLPENDEGDAVFSMSYNSRTELNLCCEVVGKARVRMARHPYSEKKQQWGPWLDIGPEFSFHLNEATGGSEEECHLDAQTESLHFFRNKHEIKINDGHMTLFSLFDPAPTGVEKHQAASYREEEPLSQVLGTRVYDAHLRELTRLDQMVDQLSLAKAKGILGLLQGTPVWETYLEGRKAQTALESAMLKGCALLKSGRDLYLSKWMQQAPPEYRASAVVEDVIADTEQTPA